MTEERTGKGLRVEVVVLGTTSGERMGRGRGNSSTVCLSSTLQTVVLAGRIPRRGRDYSLLSDSTLKRSKRP